MELSVISEKVWKRLHFFLFFGVPFAGSEKGASHFLGINTKV